MVTEHSNCHIKSSRLTISREHGKARGFTIRKPLVAHEVIWSEVFRAQNEPYLYKGDTNTAEVRKVRPPQVILRQNNKVKLPTEP